MLEDESRIDLESDDKTDGKRARNRRRRLKQLRDAALPLFVAGGIERVTIDDIVQGAGVAKGSFYRYYQDKEDLVDALFAPIAEQILNALDRGRDAMQKAATWRRSTS